MENSIRNNLDNPEVLEQLYRKNRKGFEKAFFSIYPEISSIPLAKFWFTRLTADNKILFNVNLKEITYVLISCLIVSIIMLIPWLFGLNPHENNFYERNLALTALLGVTLYTAILKNINLIKTAAIVGFFIISAFYLNVLPKTESSSTTLIYLHLPILLWFIFGIVFSEFELKNNEKRIEFIKYNGDLAVLFGIFAIAGMILTAFTIGLFSAIGINVEKVYFELIVIPGVVSVPIICTYLINKFEYLSNKIVTIVANIFSPLILITLIIYLISIVAKGSNPFVNRDFLIIFNAMLIGVVALVIFSISERVNNSTNNYYTIIFTALSTIALLINVVALLAILYRITEYGITPNRLAVIGSNLLFFTHLILILTNLLKVIRKKQHLTIIEQVTAKFLPYYGLWLIFVVFILPLIFNFK